MYLQDRVEEARVAEVVEAGANGTRLVPGETQLALTKRKYTQQRRERSVERSSSSWLRMSMETVRTINERGI